MDDSADEGEGHEEEEEEGEEYSPFPSMSNAVLHEIFSEVSRAAIASGAFPFHAALLSLCEQMPGFKVYLLFRIFLIMIVSVPHLHPRRRHTPNAIRCLDDASTNS